jgi:hypothetical protein
MKLRHKIARYFGADFLKEWGDRFPDKTLKCLEVDRDEAQSRIDELAAECHRLRGVVTDRNREIRKLKDT